jgi:glutathione S-transferase
VANATIYVIPGSHPCRTGMLLLEHKGIPYRRVNLLPGTHSAAVRILGFPAIASRTDQLGEGRHRSISLADRLGTVPALRFDGERVQTNREIARFLERVKPEPPLFPGDPERRRAVEDAELWGDEELQMSARRIVLAGGLHPDVLRNHADDGRLGFLLYRRRPVRRRFVRMVARAFEVDERVERELLESVPAMLDRVDAWIESGVLNGEQLNAADYMIVTSLALLTYRRDLEPLVMSRLAGALVDRVLPDPTGVQARAAAAA